MAVKKRLSQKRKNKTNFIRLIKGGGCSAPDVVSQYISPMCHTMTKGFEGTSNIFQKVFEGPGPGTSELAEQYNLQYGGGSGLTIDLDNIIEKTPTYVRYDDQAPPVLLNGKMHFSNCDYNQCGAGKISLYKVKKMSNRRPTKKSKSKSKRMTHRKSHSKKNMNLRSKSKPRKQQKKSSKKSKKQLGGMAPINFAPDFMNMGGSVNEPSIFSQDMNTRDFSCNQPNWSPKCI
jgi:hypothetical protein